VTTSERPAIPAPWVPAHPIALTTMSEADAMDLRAKHLAGEVQGLVDPPVVELVRWTTWADWGTTVAQCLQDAGFNVVGAGSTLLFPDSFAPAQQSAFNLAFYVCDSKYTLNPKYGQPLTADQLGLWYDYEVEWLVPCLASLGVTVSQPPTRETFIAHGLQHDITWSPSNEADTAVQASPEKETVMYETCPTYPLQYMWG